MTIKVPAPFAGISDLGFTAQYRAQQFNEPQRDVPLLIEGPEPPMRRLAELLQLLTDTDSMAYAWSDPVMLSDEVVVLDGGRIAEVGPVWRVFGDPEHPATKIRAPRSLKR